MVDVFDFDYLDSAGLLARKQVDSSDLRVFVSDCTCSSCKDRADNTSSKVVALFENYSMTTLDEDKLDDHQYLLFPVTMPAFVFKIRQWGKENSSLVRRLTLAGLTPPCPTRDSPRPWLHGAGFPRGHDPGPRHG